jgi:tRNA threonylcarbamoyladenosine biosynthesis protein TsaB
MTNSTNAMTGLLLAIETATTTARVAIVDRSGALLAAREATADRHSSNLLRLCDEALREVGTTPAALGAIACGAGPGSFTGLRVGLAVAKGLALASSPRFVLVSSLRALALDLLDDQAAVGGGGGGGETIACACIDAGKGEVYTAFFRAGTHSDDDALVHPLTEEWRLQPGDVVARAPAAGRLLVAGNGALRYAEIVDAALAARGAGSRRVEVAGPSARSLARLALLRLGRGEADDLATAVPSYGRPPDITVARR